MNSYNAKHYLPLVQALAEGKLQMAEFDGTWRDIPKDEEVHFSAHLGYYRIKPEPREWWILRGLSGQDMDESKARTLAEKVGAEAVLVREVL